MPQRSKYEKASKNALGPLLADLRRDAGLSQNDLARKLQLAGWDVDRVIVAKIENRYRTITDHELLLLVRVLGLELEDLNESKNLSLSPWYIGSTQTSQNTPRQ